MFYCSTILIIYIYLIVLYLKCRVQFGLKKTRGICFYSVTSFIVVFLFMAMLMAHPFVLLRGRYQRKFHNFVAKIWTCITISPFFRLKIQGSKNLSPQDCPVVYLSNHQSFLDIYPLLTPEETSNLLARQPFSFFIISLQQFQE